MKRSLIVLLSTALVVSFGLTASVGAEIAGKPVQSQVSGYVDLNDIKMYYEIQGIGRPLVLIHQGVRTIDTCFGMILPPLAKELKGESK